MTVARRLAAIESALTPTQLVLRWVEEAHAHQSLESCTRALLDLDPAEIPLERLRREAEHSARASATTHVREEVKRAVLSALRETAFRLMLVLRINVVAHEQMEKESWLQFGYAGHLAALARASDDEICQESHGSALEVVARIIATRLADLEASAEGRRLAEERYLDGRSVLFPDAAAAWDACLESSRQALANAATLAEVDGVDLSQAQAALSPDRVETLLADLVDWSKATALEKIGEGERGLRIARSWLRAKLD